MFPKRRRRWQAYNFRFIIYYFDIERYHGYFDMSIEMIKDRNSSLTFTGSIIVPINITLCLLDIDRRIKKEVINNRRNYIARNIAKTTLNNENIQWPK